jgi:Ca2+-binding EF-hand superfamily protein
LHSLFDDLQVRLAHAKRPPFTVDAALTPEGLEKKMAEVDNAELERSKALHTELARQIEIVNDGICKQFAEAVKVFQDWLAGKKSALAGDKTQPLDKQLAALEQSCQDQQAGYDKHIGEVEKHAKRIAERAITLNKFTPLKKEDLESAYKQYLLMVDRKRALLKNQIEESKKGGLTEEQVAEINAAFKHFDRNGTNDIDRRELRACLQSLGQDATPKDIDHVMSTYAPGSKTLNFEAFKKFMVKALGDNDNAQEILAGFRLICFDADNVTLAQLQALINDLSWRQKHVDYLKQNAKPKGSGLDYETWTTEVFSR